MRLLQASLWSIFGWLGKFRDVFPFERGHLRPKNRQCRLAARWAAELT